VLLLSVPLLVLLVPYWARSWEFGHGRASGPFAEDVLLLLLAVAPVVVVVVARRGVWILEPRV
jgi:hypothetical protein